MACASRAAARSLLRSSRLGVGASSSSRSCMALRTLTTAASSTAASTLKAPVNKTASRNVHITADASHTDRENVPESHTDGFKVQLSPESFKTYRLEEEGVEGPSLEVEITKEKLIWLYDNMVKMRRMEMAADALYKQRLIRGFCHLAIGQEAVAVGMESAMKKDDKLITAYRCHPFTVMRGGSIKSVIAELFGRQDGISKGKGGSMHMFTPTFFGGNGIVGAQVPVGAGLAFTQKYKGEKNAVFAMYGDGASNQGQVFEAYNMAKLWKLPISFVCENNKYGMGTSAERSSMNTSYYTRGDVIPGLQVNAMDVLAVHAATKWAADYCAEHGPLVIEMVTYRYGGHSLSDPGVSYRTREEIQAMRSSSDPIQGLKTKLLEWGIVEEAELKKIDKAAKEEVDRDVEEAKKSPWPEEKELWSDVYYPGTEPEYLRGREREEIHYFKK